MKGLGQLLVDKKFITPEQLKYALEMQKSRHGLLGEILVELGFVTEDHVVASLCDQLSTEHRALAYFQSGTELATPATEISTEALAAIPTNMLVKHRAMPVRLNKQTGELTLGMLDPSDFHGIDEMRFACNLKIKPIRAHRNDIEAFWKKHYHIDARAAQQSQLDLSGEIRLTGSQDLTEASIVKLVDNVLSKAIALGASDIHCDVYESDVTVRFRIDGMLYNVLTIPVTIYPNILARFRILGNMDLTERKEAQDGHFTVRGAAGQSIEVRISIVPVYNGHRLALRLLDKSSFAFDVGSLGLHKRIYEKFVEDIRRPYGFVLVTGPTGSGKTTTLYSILNFLNDSSKSIVSIEDPVEYGFRGVGQVQVDERADFSFASALRAVLRQDPNVILLGEIRDAETAEIATRASLTGHLVLATMHTNDAPTAIARLTNMGVKSYLIASSLNMAIAQRLVRKLCSQCAADDKPNPRFLLKLGLKPNQVEKLKFVKGRGCKSCNFTGYKGRIGVFEIMFISNKMKELIASQATIEELRRQAKKEKMITLAMDGLYKAKERLTTVEEVVQQTQF